MYSINTPIPCCRWERICKIPCLWLWTVSTSGQVKRY